MARAFGGPCNPLTAAVALPCPFADHVDVLEHLIGCHGGVFVEDIVTSHALGRLSPLEQALHVHNHHAALAVAVAMGRKRCATRQDVLVACRTGSVVLLQSLLPYVGPVDDGFYGQCARAALSSRNFELVDVFMALGCHLDDDTYRAFVREQYVRLDDNCVEDTLADLLCTPYRKVADRLEACAWGDGVLRWRGLRRAWCAASALSWA